MWCFDSIRRPRRLWAWTERRRRWRPFWTHEATQDQCSAVQQFSYLTVSLHVLQHEAHGDSRAFVPDCTHEHHPQRLIRLLRLFPDGDGDVISCHIRAVDLNARQPPEYDALSYTWGPTTRAEMEDGITPKQKHPILVNGGRLLVTENLYNCLHQLKADECYGKDLWIDAICVNQEDHAERCQQVSIMADIYRTADRVIVWLGAADECTKPACELIDSLSQLSETDRLTVDPQVFDNRQNSALLGASNSAEHWRALALLFGRTWFTRAWVIQEIVLARSTTVLCGPYVFDWDAMVTVSHYLATHTSTNTFRAHVFDDLDARSLSYKNPTKLEAVKKDMIGGSGHVLLHSLIRCRSYDASNDHDKVYALLGLATPKDHDFPDVLYPDYHLSVAKLYRDVTKYILENVEGLHVLAHSEGDDFRTITGLPSWVPDWSVRAELGLRITGYKRFSAAGTLPCVKAVQGDSTLRLKGAQLDTITRVGETKREVNHTKVCKEWLGILEEVQQQYPSRDNKDAFWRTLVADTDRRGKVPIQEPWDSAFDVWMGLNKSPSVEDQQRAIAYETSFTHSLNVRLFRTSNGHLGLGSQSCKPGDAVWIIQGSRVPLILRPINLQSGGYSLVGGTYLHGFMQGESLDSLHFETLFLV
ncbi:HET-domain-containing protein [Xylariaceae sp. FL0016]|nr:HET-domain-containing protein [Xylariaceae sp. FL0016]